jgi:hypothetical protein
VKEIVAEVQKIERSRNALLTLDETRGVLRELDLPAELLDEALAAIRARNEASHGRRRTIARAAGAAIAVLAVAAGLFAWRQHESSKFARTVAASAYVGAGPAEAATSTFHRSQQPELVFRVTLKDAPLGEKVPLACDWLGPEGRPLHQSSWRTQPIDRDPWPTHCRMQATPASPTGTWRVRMTQDGREIASQTLDMAD